MFELYLDNFVFQNFVAERSCFISSVIYFDIFTDQLNLVEIK